MAKKLSPKYEGSRLLQPRLPADQRTQETSRNAAIGIENKSPTLESAVVTSFDARPIFAHDFVVSGTDTVALDSVDVDFTYIVPAGVIDIIRGFKYSFTVLLADIPLSNLKGVINVDGITAQGFESIQLGQSLSDYQPCYILANSLAVVNFKITFSGTYLAKIGDWFFNAMFYGNRLLATGKPLTYEPGFTNSVPVHTSRAK